VDTNPIARPRGGGPPGAGVLYYGDNLGILRRYIPDDSVDLVYLDPPFNSNRDFNVHVKHDGCCSGCAGLIALMIVVGIPLEAWESANLLGRIGIIAAVLIVLSILGYVVYRKSKANNAKAREQAPH
jgi:hypothetical protein